MASNSFAAQKAAQDAGYAAIASIAAARANGLDVIAENIQDVAQNTTRFLVLGRDAMARSGADKTRLVFALPERAGALHAALDAVRARADQSHDDPIAAPAREAVGLRLLR